MILTSDIKFQNKLKRWADYLALAVLLIAAIALTGWQFDIKQIIHPFGLPPMNPAAAVTFILFSISFFLLRGQHTTALKQRTGRVLAILVLLVGLIKIAGSLFRFDPVFDSILYHDQIFAETSFPLYAHMSPIAALCFVNAGLALLLLDFETVRKRMPSHYLALIIAIFGLSSFIAYIFTVKAFFGDYKYVYMAIHTAISFIFISASILFATPGRGLMKEFTSPFAGSIAAWRLIPMAIFIPIVLGFIRLYIQLKGYISYEFGITVFIMSFILSMLGFIIYITKLLNRRDRESKEAEYELTETNYFLNTVLENIPDMIFVKDAKELRFFRFNKAGEEMLGYSRSELIGKNDYDFFPKEQADFFTGKDRETLNSDTVVEIPEEPISTKKGDRWVHTKKIPVRDENGNPLYLLGIAEDITEKRIADEQIKQLNIELKKSAKQSEASALMFSSLFYRSPVMKAITDAESGRYMEVNDAFALFMEFEKEEIRGKTSIELNLFVNPHERDQIMKTLHENGFIRDVETQIRLRSGRIAWISANIDKINLNGKDCYLTAALDITERKHTAEKLLKLSQELEQKVLERTAELAKSEERFRKILENNYEAISLLDENFIPFYRSPAAHRITGWTTEERVREEGGIDQVHPDDVGILKKVMEEVVANSGKPIPVLFRTKHKKGHYIWLEGFMTNMLHDQSLNGIVANLRDVTQRKLYETRIEQSEAKFRKLLENNYEIISLADKDFIPFYRNPSSDIITGWTMQESAQAGGGMDHIHPDDVQFVEKVFSEVLASKGKAIPVSFRTKHKKGHYILMEGFMTNMLHDESLKGIISNFRDITEARIAEERLARLLREFSDYRYALDESSIVVITDQKGIIKYANENFCRISRYSVEELIGQDHRILNSAYHPKEFIRNLWNTISGGKIWRGEIRNRAKDGTLYWVDTTIVPFLKEDGKPYQYIAIRTDITEKKKVEDDIYKLTEELRQLLEHTQTSREEERKYIAREIHDELGQRLTAMKIDLSILRRKVPAGESQGYFSDEISSVVSQIDQSIETVKKIATDLRPEILDHHGIIAAVKWQAVKFENSTGVKCRVSYLPEEMNLRPELSTAVYRTVQEALTNIARHAQATSVSVLIEQDAEKLLVEIKDNGKGINEEKVKSITSLGLIGIRERVHLLKGTVSIIGKQGKGTIVSVNIPINNHTI